MDIAEVRATFRAQCRIPNNVEIQHCEWLVLNIPSQSVVIRMITFIEDEMELPMGRVTRDYLINYRLTLT